MSAPALVIERSQTALVIERTTAALSIEKGDGRQLVIQRDSIPGKDGSSGGAANTKIDVIASVANGQTVFALTAVPLNPALARMSINGQIWRPPSFAIIGSTATWAAAFSIQSTDEIEFSYTI